MKTFIVTFRTNYGLGVAVINAFNYDDARKVIVEHNKMNNDIQDGYEIVGLDTAKHGVVFIEHS